ncbi:hypothetical protein C1H71_05060 [Iodobacter fluviatilis]|jgi:hypothetical protein|uniref:Uncharacterized protein n=2 Tax=Iodobacter fluviatilis TaxID=537 RepID=A0A7G3G7H5_9NEIS|nr:hypothetical protein C1H71_05060 [Iodobacter fluviatilis]
MDALGGQALSTHASSQKRRIMMKPADPLSRQHDIQFYPRPAQANHAFQFLATLTGISVQIFASKHRICVRYQIKEHTLQSIENQLKAAGFHLDESILSKIKRALIYYCEDIARSNLEIPEHNIKSRDVYVKVWDNHPHGDHDETPEELRRYL